MNFELPSALNVTKYDFVMTLDFFSFLCKLKFHSFIAVTVARQTWYRKIYTVSFSFKRGYNWICLIANLSQHKMIKSGMKQMKSDSYLLMKQIKSLVRYDGLASIYLCSFFTISRYKNINVLLFGEVKIFQNTIRIMNRKPFIAKYWKFCDTILESWCEVIEWWHDWTISRIVFY